MMSHWAHQEIERIEMLAMEASRAIVDIEALLKRFVLDKPSYSYTMASRVHAQIIDVLAQRIKPYLQHDLDDDSVSVVVLLSNKQMKVTFSSTIEHVFALADSRFGSFRRHHGMDGRRHTRLFT